MRCLLFLLLASACASAREIQADVGDDTGGDDAGTKMDASMQGTADAPKQVDAPPANPCAFSGVMVTYSFASAAGNQASTAASTTATGVTAAPITRAATLTAVSGAGSINSSNWATSATLDPTKYYTFSITPPSGCALTLTSAAVDAKSSGTGPASAAIATSADNYATTAAVSTSAASTPALTVSGATSAVEIRVYGYGATATGGTMRLQSTLTINGSLQ